MCGPHSLNWRGFQYITNHQPSRKMLYSEIFIMPNRFFFFFFSKIFKKRLKDLNKKNCDTLDYLWDWDRMIHVLCKNVCIFYINSLLDKFELHK